MSMTTDSWLRISFLARYTGGHTPTRVLLFHVIASGRCWIQVLGGERQWAIGGDVIVLPYNDEHRIGGTTDTVAVSVTTRIDRRRGPDAVIRYGQGWVSTQAALAADTTRHSKSRR